jgi:phage portal protein BeeE
MANSPGSGSGITVRNLGPVVQALQQYGRQLYQPPDETIRGIDAGTWYSPLQPVKPIAPEGTEPRGFQYWAGQNLLYTPRADAEYSAAALKALAMYPLARICIENVKDSVAKIPWEVQLRRKPGETKKEAKKRAEGDAQIVKLSKFFERPDREHNWQEWLRPLMDDLLVLDAVAILIRKTFKGEIVELPVLRGDSIVRYIDVNGWTPMPPQPAYAQNWWGIPLVNLTTDQLIYKPRNIVPRNTISSQLYGMSPVEQLATEIEIGAQRLAFTLAYYTEGSTPGVVQVVPKGTPPDKIAEAMTWMNSELAGNLAARRQWRMVQGFNDAEKPDQIIFTKEPLLKDEFDDMHIRKIAFGFGTSAQRLIRAMNRASAEQSQEASVEEGTLPWVDFIKGLIDYIIQQKFNLPDYEMAFQPFTEPDPQKNAETIKILVGGGIITPNEGRERLGEDDRNEPEASQLGIITGTGFVLLGQAALESQAKMELQRHQQATAVNGTARRQIGLPGQEETGGDKGGEKPGKGGAGAQQTPPGKGKEGKGKAAGSLKFGKSARIKITPDRLAPQSIIAKNAVEKVVKDHFATMKRKTKKQLAKSLGLPDRHMAATMEPTLHKAAADDTVKAILRSIADDWRKIAEETEEYFQDAAIAGVSNGILQLDISDEDMISGMNEAAQEWASARAAEMVGMKVTNSGKLIANPDAKWAISETTRTKIHDIVTELFAEEKTPKLADIEARIDKSGIFNDQRAAMIARTEISSAQVNGNLESWRKSGIVKFVDWQMSSNHDLDDECDELEAGSPYSIASVPTYPAHVNCLCALVISDEAEVS